MTLPIPWNLGEIPRESAEPTAPVVAREGDQMETLERRIEEIELVLRQGFDQRRDQTDYIALKLRELEERELILDQLLQWGPIPGDRVAFTKSIESLTATGIMARWFLPTGSRPSFLGVTHGGSSENVALSLNVYDPNSASEKTITKSNLSTSSPDGDRVRSLLSGAITTAYFNSAQDWDLSQFGTTNLVALTVPAFSYYEVEVKSMSAGPVPHVSVMLILKQLGQTELLS